MLGRAPACRVQAVDPIASSRRECWLLLASGPEALCSCPALVAGHGALGGGGARDIPWVPWWRWRPQDLRALGWGSWDLGALGGGGHGTDLGALGGCGENGTDHAVVSAGGTGPWWGAQDRPRSPWWGSWDLRALSWEGHTTVLGRELPFAHEGGWVVGGDPTRTGADVICWPLEHAVCVLKVLRQIQTQH